ncbi:CHASE domain protein, partial [Vibrio parahaemolyticus V-223/04]
TLCSRTSSSLKSLSAIKNVTALR